MRAAAFIAALVLISGIVMFTPPARAAIPPAERTALITLYNATNGDSWTVNTGWKTPPLAADGFALPGTENGWYGISTNGGNTTVEEIDISANNLVGTIPSKLEDLTNLTFLKLSNNQLSGSIPTEIGNITGLQYLVLENNQLTGSIPPELGGLANLVSLALYTNQLTGSIPTELGNLINLQYLLLYNCQLTGSIPKTLGNLVNLKNLYLQSNQLTGRIPGELTNLTNLERLHLNNNDLRGRIPDALEDLTSLLDNMSDFRNNHLFTTNDSLRGFLNTKQDGGDWESSQTPPFGATESGSIMLLGE